MTWGVFVVAVFVLAVIGALVLAAHLKVWWWQRRAKRAADDAWSVSQKGWPRQ